MIEVTDGAKELLNNILSENVNDPDITLRLAARPGGRLRLIPDRAKKADQSVEKDGRTILLVGSELDAVLGGMTLDVKHTDSGKKLFMS